MIVEIRPFEKKLWLSSPTMHGDEIKYVQEAYDTNWMSTVGANMNEAEKLICEKVGCKEAVALSSGTAALHLAIKLAGERLYGQPKPRTVFEGGPFQNFPPTPDALSGLPPGQGIRV